MLERKSIQQKIVKPLPLTVVQAMDELSRVMAVPVKIKNKTIWVRTDIPLNAQKLMKTIGKRIPSKIIAEKTKM